MKFTPLVEVTPRQRSEEALKRLAVVVKIDQERFVAAQTGKSKEYMREYMRKYREERRRVEYASYKGFEPGVRDILKALHDRGIDTIMSCQGHGRRSCIHGGLFPHSLYIEFTMKVYKKNRKLLKRVCNIGHYASIHMIIDPTVRGNDRVFLVARGVKQGELAAAIYRA